MTDDARPQNTALDAFRRPVVEDAMRAAERRGSGTFTADATADERAALAEALDLAALDRLEIRLDLSAEGRGWRATGRVRGRYAQTCGVTLERLDRTLDEPIDRIWRDDAEDGLDLDGAEVFSMAAGLDAGDDAADDGPDLERTPNPIDLGAIAAETLSLAVDPFPRADGAHFDDVSAAPPGAEPLDDRAGHPFAGLSGLKDDAAD